MFQPREVATGEERGWGRMVLGDSDAQLIAGLDQDEGSDVYVPRGDLLQLASQPYGVGEASGSSLDPAISGDVYTVTFSCDARLIPADDHEWFDDVYGHSLLDAF